MTNLTFDQYYSHNFVSHFAHILSLSLHAINLAEFVHSLHVLSVRWNCKKRMDRICIDSFRRRRLRLLSLLVIIAHIWSIWAVSFHNIHWSIQYLRKIVSALRIILFGFRIKFCGNRTKWCYCTSYEKDKENMKLVFMFLSYTLLDSLFTSTYVFQIRVTDKQLLLLFSSTKCKWLRTHLLRIWNFLVISIVRLYHHSPLITWYFMTCFLPIFRVYLHSEIQDYD